MDKKKVAAAASRAEVVRLWEALFDDDSAAARIRFMDALLRDARADHARKEQEDEARLAHVFQPWHPPEHKPRAVPPPEQKPPPVNVVAPKTERTLVLGLCAPPQLQARRRRQNRTPPGTPAAGERHPEPEA